MKRLVWIIATLLLISGCTPKGKRRVPPEQKGYNYFQLLDQRAKTFRSAAYLIDLRINDDGRKFSITTEAYFSGDSAAFYGRGYVGKGAFKGSIINGVVTIHFKSENEYFTGPIGTLGNGAECSQPGEVLLYVLSLLSGQNMHDNNTDRSSLTKSGNKLNFLDGRFDHTVWLKQKLHPKKEMLIDSHCGDSIVINYTGHSRQHPFYKTQDVLYHSTLYNFRAKGFVREQQYNINIKDSKFQVDIPSSATLLDQI